MQFEVFELRVWVDGLGWLKCRMLVYLSECQTIDKPFLQEINSMQMRSLEFGVWVIMKSSSRILANIDVNGIF